MFTPLRKKFNKTLRSEKGYFYLLVLGLVALGGLMITPLLGFVATAARSTVVYYDKTYELYAADAGVEDGIWQIKFDHLDSILSGYDMYEYNNAWDYFLSEPINNRDVEVFIDNVWIPKGLAVPSASDARDVIEDGKLVVTSNVPSATTYQIKINYYKDAADNPLTIETVGVWLPAGFTYTMGSSDFENAAADYYTIPVVSDHAGGQAIIWSFSSYPFAGSDSPLTEPFPGVDPMAAPMTCTINFDFTSSAVGTVPEAVSWVTTGGVSDIPYSWDADTRVHHIKAEAEDTSIEAWVIKSEIRELGSTVSGDYRAVGNSLMQDNIPDWGGPNRDTLLTESSSAVSDIPVDAEVNAAYLYWSGFLDSVSATDEKWHDSCSDFDDWSAGSDWSIYWGRFRAHHESGGGRELVLSSGVVEDLSPYLGSTVTVNWEQDESGDLESSDGLDFALSADNGNTWSSNIQAFRDDNPPSDFSYVIPDEYLTSGFKIKFYLVDCEGGDGSWSDPYERVELDDITISVSVGTIADTDAVFEIDGQQVYFDTNGDPQAGSSKVEATESSYFENWTDTYSYSCFLDVTELIKTYGATGVSGNHHGNGTYTVGDVDGDIDQEISYAGWSLILIYSSPETKGHQLYLYDDFIYSGQYTNVDFDQDGNPGGSISGFLVPEQITGETNAARLTCFVCEGDDYYNGDYMQFNGTALSDGQSSDDVWNSWSVGMSEDGVDIDTFDITWSSGLLSAGDTSAQIDLPTDVDIWNLVYIIISFRSESTSGGAIQYLINN